LLTEHSAINQQIAIRTIKKFGFSVNAVWNGKEALDYLMDEPSPTHPKPDIVLMDVQMPILDGYRATHLIRHHSPYSNIATIRTLPIVAMTASAIQGDKEKCKKAGMDDYLAKPVKGKTLETMLLKWAVEGKRKARLENYKSHHADHDSNCTDPDSAQSLAWTDSARPSRQQSIESSENNTQARTIAQTSGLPGTETEGDRGMQRVEAEEKATSLRNDKLLAASAASIYQHHITMSPPPTVPSKRPGPPAAALTEENVTRLDRERESDLNIPARGSTQESISGDSLAVNSKASSDGASTVGSLHSPRKAARSRGEAMGMTMRGKLARNGSDRSQVTVTPGNSLDEKGLEEKYKDS